MCSLRFKFYAVFVLVGIYYQSMGQRILNLEATPQGQVGDITFDASIDDAGFNICNANEVYEYYWGALKESSTALDDITKAVKGMTIPGSESGFITFRFIVNCQGESGRFRFLSVDQQLKASSFSDNLTNLLLTYLRSVKGWGRLVHDNRTFDYYQIITFKIEGSRVTDVLP